MVVILGLPIQHVLLPRPFPLVLRQALKLLQQLLQSLLPAFPFFGATLKRPFHWVRDFDALRELIAATAAAAATAATAAAARGGAGARAVLHGEGREDGRGGWGGG